MFQTAVLVNAFVCLGRRGHKMQTPLSEIHGLMDHYFRKEHWLSKFPEPWTEGGALWSISRGMKLTAQGNGARWIASSMVHTQLARGAKLSFVYDFLAGSSVAFSSLRYILDAARAPLHTDLSDEEFVKVYGLSRRLSFKAAGTRKVPQHNLWDGVYE